MKVGDVEGTGDGSSTVCDQSTPVGKNVPLNAIFFYFSDSAIYGNKATTNVLDLLRCRNMVEKV
jgi:hypothetical protein